MTRLLTYIKNAAIILLFLLVLFSALISLYDDRERFIAKFQSIFFTPDVNESGAVNSLITSSRQIPPDNILDLNINDDANTMGQWSAPIDWNVTAIHAVLLPNSNVMTFGSYAIEEKENTDIRANKTITLTNGLELQRDVGSSQWVDHAVNSGVDFDIWDVNQGYGDSAHQVFIKPVLMDAWCSIVRVIDSDRMLILGGNMNHLESNPDTQNSTMIYNVKERKFEMSKSLNYKRWYGSVVQTGDNKLVIVGGKDVTNSLPSTIPEILDLEKIEDGWKILDKAESYNLFGDKDSDENNYPRAFLSSDGNIVGISYNKIWVMDKSDGYRALQTGEIPLVESGFSKILEDPNYDYRLKLLTISNPVGSTFSTVMIEKDQLFVFGGKQVGEEYSPSNKVMRIDFTDSNYPKIEELGVMHSPRSNGNATILPNGEVFLNGGQAGNRLSENDRSFSVLVPEIYNPKNSTSKELSSAHFSRNYHATSLLLPDGTILTAGGDVWNAEIFYPPYLFTKDWNNKTILAERPEILDLNQDINRGSLIINTSSSENISKVTLISTGSVTHAQGTESKFTTLKFSKLTNNQLLIEIPENRNEIQPGMYMMFLINDSEVPSHGKIVHIN